MSRQENFEKAYAEAHDLPVETMAQYRMGDSYRLPMIAKCWRFWNLALDSVDQSSGHDVLMQIHHSENVESIVPLADRTEFVLSDVKFEEFEKLLASGKSNHGELFQERKPRWTEEDKKND